MYKTREKKGKGDIMYRMYVRRTGSIALLSAERTRARQLWMFGEVGGIGQELGNEE
jgi:hypothetical protein